MPLTVASDLRGLVAFEDFLFAQKEHGKLRCGNKTSQEHVVASPCQVV